MSRYIDADKLKTQLTEAVWLNKADLFVAYGTVALMPASDVSEVRHGRWIIDEWDTPNCSVCGCSGIDDYYATPYCPHCGAKMDEVEAKQANPCDTCYIAQNYNLEDDDSPCLNCGVE